MGRIIAVFATAAWAAQAQVPDAREAMRAAVEKQHASVARQREAVRKQAENLGVFWTRTADAVRPPEAIEPVATPDCDPIPDAVITPILDEAAKSQALDGKLLRAVIEQESAYRPCAVSAKGARGLMQLMPATGRELGLEDPFDPRQNVEAGSKYLKQLLEKYGGDVAKALGAYNAGPGTVDEAGGVPSIPETRDYVKAILQKLRSPPAKPLEN